ncbi:hypothetical protein L1987_73875 [Smallanthus sonchifolius]|uniref:Uncharacterized protein n=1 Tax=Smallanthus sonchifolius TaxID=185202 RepID=A0ACB9A0N7_9ASTR|nr:hypothetical protein L1987_73875 [Smallanthus sonchifolius]
MKETEIEEGEARFDEIDANIDPDTALSYIDKRLQYVLGHFQKEFEGEVSAEILGPKFGGYGSFLPAYKHPPMVQPHRKALNPNKPSSPNNFLLEGAPALLNPVACVDPVKPAATHHRDVFVDQNVLSANDMASKDTSLLHGDTCFSKRETTTSKSINPTEQRSLKVRIKVGYDKSAIKKDEIYSGLGLLTPSSSTGKNPEESGGPPIESHDFPFDSPDYILGDMTSIFVPGNRLLSPLNESLICLKIKVMPIIGRKTSSSVVDDASSVLGEGRQMEGKEVSSLIKSAGFEDEKVPVSEKGMKTESVYCKQGLTNHFKVKLSSDSVISEANRATKKVVPLKKRVTRKESDESYEQKNVKKLSLDSRGIKQMVCKNEPVVIKPETDLFEKKVRSKATTCDLREKIPKNIEELSSERKNKLTGVQTKENLRPSLSGSMKDKKSALKDIVKVRNSYKDILDTDNGAIEVANVERIGIPAEVPVPQQTEVGPAAPLDINVIPDEVAVPQQTEVGPAPPPDNWVGCDRCEKWRLLPIGIEPDNLPDKWLCSMSTWLPGRNHCDISEDETTKAVQEMNLQLISQNQNSLHCNGSRGNIGNSDHTNSNVNSETMANKFIKIKSRPEDCSSSLIETSHSSMDAQQQSRRKRKSLIETNQSLLENNGGVKAKRLKSKTLSDQYETVILNKIKSESAQLCSSNGDHQPKDRLVISVKRHTENTPVSMKSELLDKKVEIHAKKRKLKDWQESQLYANTLESSEDRIKMKDKRLKTEVKESTHDTSFNKGKTMKIKLSCKENLVDTSHEKNQQHKEKINCKKDLESERCLPVATSSSSKISGSCRRNSLQERKGSPVGSVSSSSIKALNLDDISPAAGKTIPRKAHVRTEVPRKDIDASQSQRSGGKVDGKHKEASKIRNSHNMEHATGQSDVRLSTKADANGAKDNDERSNFQRIMVRVADPLTGQPNKMRRVEVDASAKIINDGKIVGKKYEAKLGDMGSPQMNPTVKKDLKNIFVGDISNAKDPKELEPKVEIHALDGSGQNQSKVMKHPGDAANQNAKSLVTDCGTIKSLSVISFLKEYSSSQTALIPFKKAEESKDYADRLKISGFDYECNDACFDSALKFLYAASLLEVCTADISKSKGVDPITGYTTSAKLSKICAQEFEKRKETAAAALAYKCMEVAYMRIVYCKSLLTRLDLQTSMQMVTQGESPSSSASDVDNLNNQSTTNNTMLSKNIAHPGNQLVVRNQASFMRLLDLTSDVSLAMEASLKSQNAYKVLEESQNNEMMISVKRVVDFSFQDVKEIVCLVQNTREAINRQGFKGNNRW